MFRTAMLLVAALAAPALAQPPGAGAARPAVLPVPPAGPAVTFKTVRVEDGKLLMPVFRAVPVTVQQEVTVTTPGGRTEKQVVTVTQFQAVEERLAVGLDTHTLTDAAGKAIDAKRAAELLKEDTAVVVVSGGPLPEQYRKLFRDGTVFLQMPNTAPRPLPAPAVRPLPAPVDPVPSTE